MENTTHNKAGSVGALWLFEDGPVRAFLKASLPQQKPTQYIHIFHRTPGILC